MSSSLIRGRYVVVDRETVLGNSAVFQADGKIQAVGAYPELKSRYPTASELGGPDHVVIPGLVNAHHHVLGLTAFQMGWLDEPLEPWLLNFLGSRTVDPYDAALYSFIQLLHTGVTTALHHHVGTAARGFREGVEAQLRAAQDSGIRCSFAMGAQDQNHFTYELDEVFFASIPEALRKEIFDLEMFNVRGVGGGSIAAEEYFSHFEALFRECEQERRAGSGRVRMLLGPRGVEWCSDDLLRRVKETADAFGTGVHLHILESIYMKLYGPKTYGAPIVTHMNEIGLLGPNVSCAHCVWMTERDIDLFAETGTTAITNPSANLRLSSGIAPVNRMRAAGVNVALGIDANGLNEEDDYWQEMRLALRLHQEPGIDSHRPSSGDIFDMATRNGARAALWEGTVGMLKEGHAADVVLLRWPAIQGIYLAPEISLLDALVYRAKPSHVDTVMVDGEVLIAGGQYQRRDEGELARRLAAQAAASEDPLLLRLRNLREKIRPFVEEDLRRGSWDAAGPSHYLLNARE